MDAMKSDTAADEDVTDMYLREDEAPCESPTANKGNINPNFLKTSQARRERRAKFSNDE
jgi:hypothetical protein